jgi:hypothetical protein
MNNKYTSYKILYLFILIMSDVLLKQGKHFIHNKNKNPLDNQNINQISGNFRTIEGFEGNLSTIENTQTNIKIENDKQLEELKVMQKKFAELLNKYNEQKILKSDETRDSLVRSSNQNPYSQKNIKFSTGEICYVTKQGIAKLYPTIELFNNTSGLNGCPKEIIDINIPWLDIYNEKGATIPTSPSLKVGTPMKEGQACGNEGTNIYSTYFTDNISSSYFGCNRNYPSQTNNVNLVPKMTSNSNEDIELSASSVYLNSNPQFGPWRAFDGNINTFWHSATQSENIYNAQTGIYLGRRLTNAIDKSNNSKIFKGETLTIKLNNKKTSVISYSITPRQDGNLFKTRSPNSWNLLGLLDDKWYVIDNRQNINFDKNTKMFKAFDDRLFSAFMLVILKVGNNNERMNRYCVQIAELKLNVTDNFPNGSEAMQTTNLNFEPNIFERCKAYAFENGYNFFGLQDFNKNTMSAKCVVSNDLTKSTSYGDGMKVYKLKPIWSTNTDGQPGNTATLSNTGSLQVINTSGEVVYSTPGSKTLPDNYLGCYMDRPKRAMPNYLGNGKTYESCQSEAQKGNWAYFGLQFMQSNNTSECWVNNNLDESTRYGKATNCRQAKDGTWNGGGWSNAIYNTSLPQSNSFLLLQNDGNMVIYRGTGPSNNQGAIWSSRTNNLQKEANPKYISSNNKYGRAWITTGETLGSGDFISTDDGKLVLMMEPNGNLILYSTITLDEGCVTQDNTTFGTNGINAIYQLNNLPNKNYLGKYGYVDEDTNLREYSGDAILKDSKEYMLFKDYDSPGNDIQRVNNTTLEALIELCNKNNECRGFLYNTTEKYGFLKNKNMFPKSRNVYIPNSGYILGVKKVKVRDDTPCSKQTNEISAYKLERYPTGDNISENSQCFRKLLSGNTLITLDKYKNELNILGKDIASKMKDLYNKNQNIYQQLSITENEFKRNISEYENISKKIENELQNLEINSNNIEGMQNLSIDDIDGMLNDSDLIVLQQNYSYFLWSILAIGTVAATMNIIKK